MLRLTLGMAVLVTVVGVGCSPSGPAAQPEEGTGPPHSDAAVLIGRRGGLCPSDDGDGGAWTRTYSSTREGQHLLRHAVAPIYVT